MSVMTSREFNQDTSRAKKAAENGPLFITDRGRPAHVLMTIEEYQKLSGKGMSLLEAVAMKHGGEIEFEPPRFDGWSLRIPDFD